MVGGSGTVMSAVSGVSSSSGGSSGQPTPIALVPNVIDSLSRLSSSQVNKYWKVTGEKLYNRFRDICEIACVLQRCKKRLFCNIV